MSRSTRPHVPTNAFVDALEPRTHLTAVSFAIDPAASELHIAATARASKAGTVKLAAQSDGLDAAALAGTLVADFSSKGIRFNGGSTIKAIDHDGSFSPGAKPAAFAVDGKVKRLGISLATVKAAVRNLTLDLDNTSRKKVGKDHRFVLRNGSMTSTGGTLDYKLDSRFGKADGSKSLADLQADLENDFAKLIGKTGVRVITVPIEVKFVRKLDNDSSATFTLKGQIVARETTRSKQGLVAVATTSPIHRRDERAELPTSL